MKKSVTKFTPAYKVEIFMAGNIHLARMICLDYCSEVGLCVTVTPTHYVYKGGQEEGFIVGLINYPRFPKSNGAIWATAYGLAERLFEALGQGSFTVQDSERALFYSEREVDTAQQTD